MKNMINKELQLYSENLITIDGNIDIYENKNNLEKMINDVIQFLDL
jgi:hypothetical protein